MLARSEIRSDIGERPLTIRIENLSSGCNQIEWQAKALRQLRKIDNLTAKLIRDTVTTELIDFSQSAHVRPLTAHRYAYRLRVGDFRVLFNHDRAAQVVIIAEIRRRNERTY